MPWVNVEGADKVLSEWVLIDEDQCLGLMEIGRTLSMPSKCVQKLEITPSSWRTAV